MCLREGSNQNKLKSPSVATNIEWGPGDHLRDNFHFVLDNMGEKKKKKEKKLNFVHRMFRQYTLSKFSRNTLCEKNFCLWFG